jgi:hypothetical protein
VQFAADELHVARLAVYWDPDDWETLADARLETLEALCSLAERLNVRPPSVLMFNSDPGKPANYCGVHNTYTKFATECPICSIS